MLHFAFAQVVQMGTPLTILFQVLPAGAAGAGRRDCRRFLDELNGRTPHHDRLTYEAEQ
jgi:hypothetical protein